MTPTEAVKLSHYIRAYFPHQPQDEFTADALGEMLAPFPAADCRQAVVNIADRGEKWCAPTDVRAEVRRIRSKRIEVHPHVDPPAGLDDPRDYQRWKAELNRRIGDGQTFQPDHFYAGQLVGRGAEIRELLAAATTIMEEAE